MTKTYETYGGVIRDWEGKDELFTDEERVREFKSILASRKKLDAYNERGMKQYAGTSRYARVKGLRDRNLESIERLKRKIVYYSAKIVADNIDAG